MPAVSQAQFRFMQMIAHGGKPRAKHAPSRAVARHFIKGQKPKRLPKRKRKDRRSILSRGRG